MNEALTLTVYPESILPSIGVILNILSDVIEVTSILQYTGFLSGLLKVISTVAAKHFSNEVIIFLGNSTHYGSITNLGFKPRQIIYFVKL